MTSTFVLVLLVKITVLLGAGVIAAAAARRNAAAVRHAIWMGALASALILPALAIGMPAWRLNVIPARRTATATLPTPQRPAPEIPYANGEAALQPLAQPSSSTTPMALDRHPVPIQRESAERDGEGSPPMTTLLRVIWFVGVAIGCVRLLLGRFGLRRVQRAARRLTTNSWRTLLCEEQARAGVTRPVALLMSPVASTPMTWGTRRPIILLPDAAETWTEAHQRVALRHELAHIARNDAAAQLGASVACTIYWFHPLAWLAARRLRIEGERACDERVVALGTSPADYAMQLLEIARAARALGDRGLVSVAMARPSQLEQRVMAILFGRRTSSGNEVSTDHGAFGRARLMTGACAALLVVPLAMMQPSMRPPVRPATALPSRVAVAPSAALGLTSRAAITPPRLQPEQATRASQRTMSAIVPTVASTPDTLTLSWSDGRGSGSIRVEGNYELTADGKDIAALSPRGLFAIEERLDGTTRRVEIRADTAGSLRRTWMVNGAVRPYGRDSEEWLATALATSRTRMGFPSLASDDLNQVTPWLDKAWTSRRWPSYPLLPVPDPFVPDAAWSDSLMQHLRKAQSESAKFSQWWNDSLWKQLGRQQWPADSTLRKLRLQMQQLSDSMMHIERWPDSLWTNKPWADSLLQESMGHLDSLMRVLNDRVH